jgi:uncharacterized protein DUF6600
MKKFAALGIAISLAFFVSCGKQQTEAEKNAEIERQVQKRLAAERQADEQQKLAQREADLKAREDALAQKEEAASTPTATPQMRGSDLQQRDVTEAEQVTETESGESASYNTFYTKLEPYGDWRETSDYGYVFQPNEANRSRNWRPYTNGRWVYTDAGWTWTSEEPFGWATYHYGRWARLRNVGWVWIPGDEWAPAWVSWRKGNDYVGWAPLPPEASFDRGRGIHNWADNYYDIGPDQYCFVPATDLGALRIERTIVPVERNVTIVNQTVNVTNITYNNTTIVNEGPNYEELLRRSRHPIQRLRLNRQQRFEGANPRAVFDGEVIEMPAPTIARARPADRPRVVKEKIAKSEVDHGWADIRDTKAAEQARAKMKAEATLPSDAPPAKVTQAQTQQIPEVAQPVETPVRNFPDRAKTKPHAFGAMSPGIKATPSPNTSRPPQETKDAMHQKNEVERAQKVKMRAEKKAAQRQVLEEQRKAKAAKNSSPSPQPAATAPSRATDSTKPAPTANAPKPVRATPSRSPITSPSPVALRESKKDEKDKKKNKRKRESPSPTPAASIR